MTAPGAQIWIQRYNGTKVGNDDASAVAVAPTGETVYVTGKSHAAGAPASVYDYATVAYDAATGARLWVQRYNGPGNGADQASSVAVSPGGETVFVTGSSDGAGSADYATVAYDAATGAQRWVTRYNGPGNGADQASSVAASPAGKTVYVTGFSYSAGSGADYATAAYDAATGAQRWVKSYNGPGNAGDLASSVAVSPGGGTVVVTGTSDGSASANDYTTVAYNAATGAQRWVKRYNGPRGGQDYASSVAVSPTGKAVYVTGQSHAAGNTSNSDYATVAYDAATGVQLWVQRYNGTGNSIDAATSVAVSPSGGTVYVTGESFGGTAPWFDYATVAYDAATGAQLWVQRYNGTGNGTDQANSIAVSPVRNTVFVTGFSAGATSGDDYITIGYSG